MKKILLCVVFTTALSSSFAQNKNIADSIFSIDEVSIIANAHKKIDVGKLNIPLKYLPLSMTSVFSKELDMRGISSIQEATKFLPNTRMRTTYGGFTQFEVRGFDYTPIMIDGVRDERTSISNSAPIGDLSAVESIELLKGPASVLYGHSTVGGIVNIKRKAPTEKKIFNALLSYGSWNNRRAMADMGGKVIGPFNYRAVVNWSDQEGYRYTNNRRFSGYLALAAKLDAKQTIDIRGGFNRDWYGTEIGLPSTMQKNIYNTDDSPYLSKGDILPNLNKRWRYNNESDYLIHNGTNLYAKYSYNFSEKFRLENRIAYNYDNIDYSSSEKMSYSESTLPIYNHYYLNADNSKKYIQLDSVNLGHYAFAYTVHAINEEIEASGKLKLSDNIKYNYLAGYNLVVFLRDRYQANNAGDLYGPGMDNTKIPSYNPVSMGTIFTKYSNTVVNRTYTNSFYLQNLFQFSDKLSLMLSGRFDSFDFRNATAKPINGDRKYSDRGDFSKTANTAFTYRAGIVYLPISNLSVYGSFANYFSPYRDLYSPNTVYVNSSGNRFYPKDGEEIFKPQSGYQAEIGTRYTLNRYLQATASAFYIHKKNEKKTLNSAYTDPDDGISKSVIGQVATSRSKGIELEVIITPIHNASLSLGYGYTDAKIEDFSTDVEKLISQGFLEQAIDTQKGLRLTGVPKNTFFAAGNYEFDKGLFKNLGLNFTLSYMDNVYYDLSKTLIYPSYWIADFGASYKLDNGVRFQVNVNNLFNDRNFNQSLGTQIVPREPRNFLFTLAYDLN